VEGVYDNRNYKDDYTVVDVEPNTGLVMHVNETIQLNCYLDPKVWTERLKVFYPNVQQDIFYPIVWVYQDSTMNELNVKMFKEGIIYSRSLQRALFGITFSLGILMLVAAVILILVIFNRNETLIDIDTDSSINLIDHNNNFIIDHKNNLIDLININNDPSDVDDENL